jgi:hypothetical protein
MATEKVKETKRAKSERLKKEELRREKNELALKEQERLDKNEQRRCKAAWKKRIKAMPPWLQEFVEDNDGMILWDGLDKAIIGTAGRCGMSDVLVYDYEKMVQEFVNDGMTDEEAVEWIDFNIVGAYVGEYTPLVFCPR